MRSFFGIIVLMALPAFATGETIVISGAEQLKDTLCLSMNCVASGPRDFVIAGKTHDTTVEITVTSTTGQRRLTHSVALNQDGQMSSTDVVTATSLIQRSIENGAINPPKPLAKPAKKHPLKRAIARR